MINIPPSTIACVNKLLDQVPELRYVYDEHIHDNNELLPHVFLGDVTRYVVHRVRLGETGPAKPVERILSVLEQYMGSGDEQVKELVSVSFVENLLKHDKVLASLKGLIGPNLQKEIRNYGI
jgi:hypothetical protein